MTDFEQNVMDKLDDISCRLSVLEARSQPSSECRNWGERSFVMEDRLENLHNMLHDGGRKRDMARLYFAFFLFSLANFGITYLL